MKVFFLGYWVIVLLTLVGWILNIAQIVKMSGWSSLMLVKVIGIFVAPLGSIMGWLGVF